MERPVIRHAGAGRHPVPEFLRPDRHQDNDQRLGNTFAPTKTNGLPGEAARFVTTAGAGVSAARGALFHALDILAVELICDPEADAGHPDHQQNLPSLHKSLPIRWLQQNLQ